MKKELLKDFNHFLDIVSQKVKKDVVLFRGQRESKSLLPKIARDNPNKDTTSIEKDMLSELRRTGSLYLPLETKDDWDLLVFAQHYGMATRLLDWSDNPLVALWFAAANQDITSSSFVYMFEPKKTSFLDRNKDKSPFTTSSTKDLGLTSIIRALLHNLDGLRRTCLQKNRQSLLHSEGINFMVRFLHDLKYQERLRLTC